ncbi:GTP pyrophosphokinase [Ameyamaea chiangmaiensis NBRC 103196]|uniref:GTP pyrophosphokinase rsh n=1 Tax=Ameyamaea chiangmaiensis TaxID=442969 RepID=A0A850P7A0_9PROT|nr:bifunctional (p)ppGpp synthetase/guanosine-3',5'-bis(diphosphate) 3'-pyrophosphohydrolase [Ameyamaea chiangmaiensis]MBS4074409.1 bifunctional (p)ppGpp synthetase/guanosine-3',5'-bis(diphosphate) 3'-pyrophosphohydrolase [Ameyamaea chiangmaiensis]NVN40485.1 bifunctional (p)ppGpp synthetase/guanosine-3',5'-bis(diphosphate) 3'-pyrophosphohydrolase [Ameyamaea chiangmaiensis]GBQ71926.1 GTP pyrophosphokinase [Ameyamaea chiangmaiensis NBRC 103196]
MGSSDGSAEAIVPAPASDVTRPVGCAGLIRRIAAYNPDVDRALIERAFTVASEAHAEQKRDNGEPYITHPIAVANILASFQMDAASIATGLLHDTVEDTGVTQDRLVADFGKTIAELVDGVTKLTRLELQSDRTKQAENFRKLVLAMSRDIRVLIVKLADRLHNMRTLHYVQRTDRRQRIARETMDIYAPLAERIGMDRVKTELQNLSFAQLDPEANATIRARLNYLRGQGADIIEEVRKELTRLCHEAGIAEIEVTGREKSPFSIWEKMQSRNVAFEQLSDIMAFRLIVPSREDCYVALGAVHAAYPVIAGRFKDYISTPKSNGYQSLHTGVTLRHPRNQKIEVQIRTAEMHDVAENGVASHWAYKQVPDARPDGPALGLRKPRWVQDLLEILEDSAAPDEFLENTKLELYQDQVFCFTPKGQLISLPRGATPIDFAYAVHSQVGDACVGAKINGRLMPLRHELQNGDQVEIMTARGGTPSPSWERFAVTGKARARIRRYVAAQQRQTYVDNGRASLTKAFRQEGVDGSERVLEGILKDLKMASVEDLYVAVGNGNVGPKDVVHAAYAELRQTPRAPRMVPGLTPRAPSPAKTTGSSLPLVGIGSGIAVHFAGCCHPLPGDRIVGIVSTGKGITIHTATCQTLGSFAATPERFMDVDWDYEVIERGARGEPLIGRVSVVAANEPSVLATLTNAAAKYDGSVVNLKIINRQLDFMEVLVDLEVRDLRHLSSVIAGLRGASGVSQVERAKG